MVRLMTLRPYRPRRRALVVGAGIAGLLTARVLADSFAEVEVLEQDLLPTTPVQRPGVAQGHHVHGLTARGAEVMERLFPGLDGQLAAAGAPGGDFGQIVAFRFPDCWSPRVPTGIPLRTFSRPLLETHLRHRLTALDRIRIRDGIRVTGVTGSPTHVTGVRVRIRTAATTVTPDGPTVPPDGSFRSCSPARRSERETSHCRPPPVRHRCASPRSTSVDGSAKARRSRPHPARTRSIDRSIDQG
ncbi:hypothetical protein SNOUR_40620 [Streptomyces noursei ATCC 11455]|uniref:FAD-dependent oxidoreductase n=1 Tax=Streptomyces noursei TaxID=1971 RepID=UPI00081C5124|nr:hypothetical protein SNOUR_40620 [Streptomyces noursei ATCC 11455]